MHVLFIASWYPSRPGDINGCFFREQAQALAAAGLRVGVITPALRSLTGPGAIRGAFGPHEELDAGLPTVRYHGVRAWSWHHGLNMRFWERTGLRAFERYRSQYGRPDVIHVHGMIFGLAWAAAIHRRHGIPFVVTEHSTEFAIGTIRPALRAYLTAQVEQASRTLAVSGDLARRLGELVPLPAPRTWTTMPNLVRSDFGAPAATGRQARAPGPLRLLNVGMLLPKKGQHRLLEALKQLVDGGLDATLRICGAGPEEAPLRALTRALGLEARVELLGDCPREQVRQEMAACDVFVLSSLYETFGVVLVEALASGKPVVATRCGGPQDIVEPGDGLLVDKDCASALAQGIREVAGHLSDYDPDDLRARCVSRFSEQAFVGRHREVYEAVAGAAPGPAGGRP